MRRDTFRRLALRLYSAFARVETAADMIVVRDTYLTIGAIMLLSAGLILVPIQRNYPMFVHYGYNLILCAIVLVLVTSKLSLGPKHIYIPLLIITFSAILSDTTLLAQLMIVVLFVLYLASRSLGEKAASFLWVGALIGSISVLVCSVIEGDRTGGIYSTTNYNIAVGAIIMSTVLSRSRWQWILTAVAFVGLFFTGSLEAVIGIGVLALVILLRKDWSKKILLPIGVLALIVIICTPLIITQQLWDKIPLRTEAIAQGDFEIGFGDRTEAYSLALHDIRILGHGYTPFNLGYDSIHNVPLRVLYEIGPIAALAWLWLMGYGLLKTRAKYIFAAILALSLFDHFMWTQLCMYTYFAIGVGTTINSDLIYRESQHTAPNTFAG